MYGACGEPTLGNTWWSSRVRYRPKRWAEHLGAATQPASSETSVDSTRPGWDPMLDTALTVRRIGRPGLASQ